MAWEKFDHYSGVGRPRKESGISITKGGIALNTAAVIQHGYEDIKYVSLWYDREGDRIGMKCELSDSDKKGRYRLTNQRGYRVVRASAFMRAYSLYEHRGIYPIEVMADGMLVITLNKKMAEEGKS